MDNWQSVRRPLGDGAAGLGSAFIGLMLLGLDATPTGSDAAADVVADFTGSTETRQNDQSGSIATVTNSQTLGTTVKLTREGVYLIDYAVDVVATGTGIAAIGIDPAAGALNTDPVPSLGNVLGRRVATAPAATSVTMGASVPLVVTREMAADATRAIVRLLLSNAAGAGIAAASIDLTTAFLRIARIGSVYS